MSEARSWRASVAPTSEAQGHRGQRDVLEPAGEGRRDGRVAGRRKDLPVHGEDRHQNDGQPEARHGQAQRGEGPGAAVEAPLGRMPDTMPRGIPTMRETMAEATTRPKVTGNRAAICWLTDWPVESEVPKFPCSAPESQCQYWTSKGSLRWSWARTRAISAGVALTPPASVTAGSPGTSASRKKTANETMSSTGTRLSRRRRTNLPTRPPGSLSLSSQNSDTAAVSARDHPTHGRVQPRPVREPCVV